MKFIPFLTIITLLISCASSKHKLANNPSNFDLEFIDYLFKDYSKDQPGVSFMVIKDGEIHLTKSYGYADLENKILATPNTNYRIASVTKQFTAFAIMLLEHQGKLSYDNTLQEIFPTFPDYGKEITIRHLLTHRSGLVRYNRFLKKGQTEQMLDRDVLHGLLQIDSTYFPPGTKYAYSNTGYAVLAQVIEKVSGISFANFIQREIFKPLKMTNSTVFEAEKEIKNRAYGYIVKKDETIPKDQSLTSAIQGDGCIYMSVMDYFNWDQMLYTNQLLPQSALKKAFLGYNENGKTDEDGYGFGWKVSYQNGVKVLEHGGSTTGFGSHVIRIPGENIAVVIFTNRNKRGKELSNRAKALISYFSKEKFEMPVEISIEKRIYEQGIEEGIKLLNELKKDSKQHSISENLLFTFAIDYLNKGQNQVAFRLFEQIIEDYPKYFGGYYGKAIACKELGKKEEAIQFFQATIKYSSKDEKWAADHAQRMIEELKQ